MFSIATTRVRGECVSSPRRIIRCTSSGAKRPAWPRIGECRFGSDPTGRGVPGIERLDDFRRRRVRRDLDRVERGRIEDGVGAGSTRYREDGVRGGGSRYIEDGVRVGGTRYIEDGVRIGRTRYIEDVVEISPTLPLAHFLRRFLHNRKCVNLFS